MSSVRTSGLFYLVVTVSRLILPILTNPGISFVLKEERTRIREYDEARAKEARQGPWVHLPNRPITAQRPYYTW